MNRNHVLFLIVLLSAPGILLPLRAQVVNDGATRTLSNETNTIPGDVTVGTNGSFTLLIFSNNALMTNSVNGLIGRNATAKSNEVRLISPTASWRMGGTLFVGSNGAMSRLVVSNGAFVENNNGTLATLSKQLVKRGHQSIRRGRRIYLHQWHPARRTATLLPNPHTLSDQI